MSKPAFSLLISVLLAVGVLWTMTSSVVPLQQGHEEPFFATITEGTDGRPVTLFYEENVYYEENVHRPFPLWRKIAHYLVWSGMLFAIWRFYCDAPGYMETCWVAGIIAILFVMFDSGSHAVMESPTEFFRVGIALTLPVLATLRKRYGII